MSISKEKPKFIHQATTLEYLYCLSDMPKWSQILYDQHNGKAYNDFLKWILPQNFFRSEERTTLKRIAELSGYPTTKISKWLREIYESIFELNEVQPHLFSFSDNVKVELGFNYFDSYCYIKTSLPVVPRIYESFDFFFVKAKLGMTSFWVKDIRHFISEDETSVHITLKGGNVNLYREFALSKALFEGNINFMDVYRKYDFEIDQELLKRR
ncbi:hypothetical protein FLGE108171_14945 [Flavobacterium gelidilacus]|uniref:hypothetical protein n=1 Tax=Flavobacterium gelidilacus TaxID=206041 RepID=UPI0003FF8915|nr:hypothetical protein [Flavobacterium gelidilacus]